MVGVRTTLTMVEQHGRIKAGSGRFPEICCEAKFSTAKLHHLRHYRLFRLTKSGQRKQQDASKATVESHRRETPVPEYTAFTAPRGARLSAHGCKAVTRNLTAHLPGRAIRLRDGRC